MLPLRMLVALMLTFLLRDADSTCSAEDNTLTLDPPEIIGKYAESFYVNCTNIDANHYGMHWTAGGKNSDEEDDKSFISWNIILSDWDLKAECVVLLNETLECTKELPITVYKNPEQVIISKHAGVEGTPYELQCDILNVAPVQKLTVRWYKNNQTIKTDTFNNTAKTPVNQTSTLTVNNINRTEHGAQFKCEAQLNFGPDGPQTPVMSDVHHVSVDYAPELKNKTYTLHVNKDDDVTLNCAAEANPPPVFTWTSDGRNISENTKNLSITQVETSASYFCTATNYLGNITQEIIVSVPSTYMAAPPAAMTTPEAVTKKGCPLTLMPAEVVVRFGDPVSVNCSSSEPNVEMGWEAAVAGINMQTASNLTWTVDKLEIWAIKPMCYVNVDNRVYASEQCNVKPDITLYKTPDTVIVSPLTYRQIQEGAEFQLQCDIINVAPVKNLVVKWYRGNELVHTQSYHGSSPTPVNEISILTSTAERDHNGARFRCVAELHLGPKGPEHPPSASSVNYTTNVQYKPRMQNCADHHTGVESNFSLKMLSCEADGNPPPYIQWYHQGKQINTDEPLNRAQSGEYTAELQNILGSSATSVNITIEYRPSLTCDSRYTVQEGDKVQIKCDTQGKPEPVITWYKDGNQIATPQRWTKHDSGYYQLIATNKHGPANQKLFLDVHYAPVITEGDDTKEVTVGDNVTLECHAESNPSPKIHWNFTSAENVRETTGGRQKNTVNINIREATSTNAGVYICVATNRYGSVRRSVTLRMKGKSTGLPTAVLWLLFIILLSIILIVLIIVYLKCSKKHGRYSFVPNKATDDSGIPMTANGVRA